MMIWNTFSCNALLFSIFNAKSNVLHFKPLVESSDLMPLISDVFSNFIIMAPQNFKIFKSELLSYLYDSNSREKYENVYKEGYF